LMHYGLVSRISQKIHQKSSGERADSEVSDELLVDELLHSGPGQVQRAVFDLDLGFAIRVPLGRISDGRVDCARVTVRDSNMYPNPKARRTVCKGNGEMNEVKVDCEAKGEVESVEEPEHTKGRGSQ